MWRIYTYALSTLLLVAATNSFGQINITSSPQEEVNIGPERSSYQINIENLSGEILQNVGIQVSLPEGIEYLEGSLIDHNGFQISESDISDLQNPEFSAANLPNGQSYSLTVEYKGTCTAIDHQLAGNIFRNLVTVNSTLPEATHTSEAYNILYPSLAITSITPKNKTLPNGESFQRTITIVNAGYGSTDNIYIKDLHPVGMEITDVDLGALMGDSLITLSSVDFSSIGNGDGFFDSNESISIVQTIYGEACEDKTYTSNISAYWMIEGVSCQQTFTYGNVYLDYSSPVLKQTATAGFSTCYSSEPSAQVLKVANTSSGAANNVEVDIYNSSGSGYDPDIFTKIDVSSIQYKVGESGSLVSLAPIATELTSSADNYSCLGAGAVGKVTLSLPDIPQGESIYVLWNTEHCCINSCFKAQLGGWKSTVRYTDNCDEAYTNTIKGQDPVEASMSFFTETPAHISDGQKKTFTFLVSGHKNTYPTAENAFYEVHFQLPNGLVYEDLEGDLSWDSSPLKWNPTTVTYDPDNGTLLAQYPLPSGFELNKTEINLKLKADCSISGVTNGSKSISMSVYFIADADCGSICKVAMACDQTVSTTLICPTGCAEGMAFHNFTIQRSSFGLPDNDADGMPDASGNLDMTKVKANRVMTNDTIKSVFYGTIKTSAQHPNWTYGYAKSTIPLGAHLTPISGSVKIYDASANTYYYASGVDIQKYSSADVGVFDMDFSIPTLVANGNNDLNNFQWEDADSVELTVFYTLETNLGGMIQEVTVNNEFYVSEVANPNSTSDKFQCGFYDENITFMGYYFTVSKGSYTSITSCSKYINQFYYLSVGDCCSNYQGGNLFPYEYRNWAKIKEAKVTIPDGYKVLNINLTQWITKATNTSITQRITGIEPDDSTGSELYFNLSQYYEDQGGTFNLSDDGFRGRLAIEIAPTCDVQAGVYKEMPWAYTFDRASRLEGGSTSVWVENQYDKVQYAPASLRLTPLNPKEDGLGKTVTWTVNVENISNSSSANNAWMHMKSTSGDIQVVAVTDADNNINRPLVGDIYQLGAIEVGSTKTYYITATYSACNLEGFDVYAGYECSSYPADFASFTCPYVQTRLSVEPKPAQFQVRIQDAFVGDECSNDLDVEVEVKSVQLAIVDSLRVNFSGPASGSITYAAATSELQYNLNEAYRAVADPSLESNIYSYSIAEIDAQIGQNGLPGVLDLNNNTMRLKFNLSLNNNFKAGEYVQVSVNGQAACGADLPQINLAVDPSIKFERDTDSGLSTGTTNSWSASWGDYDNDGLEDLFVPEYDQGKASNLYHNNGDGTFTKIENVIADDMVSATASTWGDYDNDGDLDLFIATNAGSPGLLYNNQGNGSFSRVTSGEIATDEGYDHSASWIDYDNDGLLDLFVLDIIQTNFNRLYHNNGNGTFTKINNSSIVQAVSSSLGATWSDYDNDGDLDVFIPNRDQRNFLFKNEGNGNFTQIEEGIIVSEALGSVGSSWGDYDNDGDMDLFVANAGTKYNTLYNNQGDGTFEKVTSGAIVTDRGNTHGSTWTDLDNDGDLDLYITNDAGEGNYLYINNGDGSFQKVENDLTSLTQKAFGTATADFDNDGDQDIFVANHSGEPNQLYINSRGRCNQSICFTLKGTASNSTGIGAKIRVKANIYGQTIWQVIEITSQTGGGVGSQNSMKAYFGLGDAIQAEEVIVEWPSGIIQHLVGVPSGTCHEIVEEAGSTVCGTVYHDTNGNCMQDVDEKGIPNQKITIASSEKTYQLTTNANGDYQTFLAAGSYQITQNLGDGWSACNSSGYNINIAEAGQSQCDNNFGLTSVCTMPDLVIHAGTTVLHRGFENTFIITYENRGTSLAENVEVTVDFPENVEVVSGDLAWSTANGQSYTWSIGNVEAFDEGTLEVITRTNLSSIVGEMLTTQFNIEASNGDCDLLSNTTSDTNEVMGSIDPNDIWVSDTRINRLDRELTYLIRFQNVGNYPATFVRVSDEISSHLDLSTFEMLAVSHNVSELRVDGRTLKWRFDNINLPDSTSDEAASHGFIKFKIKPLDNLIHGDSIFNQANIYFDYDGAIATNIVHTVYHNPAQRIIDVFPNPLSLSEGVVGFVGDMTYPYDLTLYNSLGIKTAEIKGIDEFKVDLKPLQLTSGIYIYQLHDQYGILMTTGRLIVK
ncbi:FG-GAP-like repeat-containing protein [Fulvivirga maritima]|uniref:FG-GAP-like repeat-containing protein n=1 Tax=Fulvivirga maritima TaxID=2904247 RepID=UPI001F25E340|nr:FG-GAP-like repeat-containing protein [Fulvivirga maritima]UII26303.1 FG-GAP-like repeat-containing protein [Fulvivirga maritima]